MDTAITPTAATPDPANGGFKRKRSTSAEPPQNPAPPAKAAKTHSSHLQINYLARQYSDTLSLVSVEDNLPTILQLLTEYGGVLERHESLAGNLGARPLGPILIKRFERLFDGPPRVLKSHGKEGTFVSWLDVVEFARHKPEQFNLEKMRDGVRVCQFYTKQSRVEISEEDFFLISSGMPQKLIPPQPIPEDEEKELGTLEIMEKSIAQIVHLADQVSARARQFKHRLLGRKNAIINRRENEAASTAEPAVPAVPAVGTPNAEVEQRSIGSPTSTSGFIAINRSNKEGNVTNGAQSLSNGKAPVTTASASTRAELMSHFNSIRERQVDGSADVTPSNVSRSHSSKSKPKQSGNSDMDYASILLNSASPVPIPNTPSSLVHYPRPTQAERLDDSGPYKSEMLSRMETLQRGDRVLPPCDRCRRLHMDCLKNLTACQGCTRKHAKCSWKDVTEQELAEHPRILPKDENASVNGEEPFAESNVPRPGGPPQPVRDEELLGEDDSDDEMRPPTSAAHPSIEPEMTSIAPPNVSVDPRSETRENDERLFLDGAEEPEKVGNEIQATHHAREEIQSIAHDILQKRMVEIPTVNATGGFEPVNRTSSESMPEVRIHEPPAEVQQLPKPDQFYYETKPDPYTVEDLKPEVVQNSTNGDGHTSERPSPMDYDPFQ